MAALLSGAVTMPSTSPHGRAGTLRRRIGRRRRLPCAELTDAYVGQRRGRSGSARSGSGRCRLRGSVDHLARSRVQAGRSAPIRMASASPITTGTHMSRSSGCWSMAFAVISGPWSRCRTRRSPGPPTRHRRVDETSNRDAGFGPVHWLSAIPRPAPTPGLGSLFVLSLMCFGGRRCTPV